MSSKWARVWLRDVVNLCDTSVPASHLREVNLAGVYSFGRGLFKRGVMSPAETSYRTYNRLATDDFVISQPKAWEGAIARVTPQFDGWFLSPVFPTFRVNGERLEPAYLEWFCKRPSVWSELQRKSRGMGARRETVSPDAFLSIQVPLPPLAEQRRVVARIEEAAAKIDEARRLRQRALEDADLIVEAEELRVWPSEQLRDAPSLGSLTVYLARGRQSEQGASDHFLIKTQHVQQGRYTPTVLRLAHHAAAKVNREAMAMEGDILIACSAAGCLGRVARYHDGRRIASTDTHVAIARPRSSAVDADYLYIYLRGAQGQRQLRSREQGDWQREKIGFRLTELNLKDLRLIPVPLPDRSQQRRIVAKLGTLHEKIDALKRLQAETAAELDALLPSILDRAFKGDL